MEAWTLKIDEDEKKFREEDELFIELAEKLKTTKRADIVVILPNKQGEVKYWYNTNLHDTPKRALIEIITKMCTMHPAFREVSPSTIDQLVQFAVGMYFLGYPPDKETIMAIMQRNNRHYFTLTSNTDARSFTPSIRLF